MEKEKISINFSPGKISLAKIETWLKEERLATGEGFYVNWSTIKNAFAQGQMAVLEMSNEPVGFAVWRPNDKLTYLDIVEIHPSHRKKGLAGQLLAYFSDHFLTIGIMVIELQCEPPESELTWKKLGFIEFASSFNSWGHKRLYKILTDSHRPDTPGNSDESISLWDREPIYARDKPPVWQWKLSFIEGTRKLMVPIVIACDKDWKLSWRKNNNEVVTKKAKYFQEDCMSGDFLVIETIP